MQNEINEVLRLIALPLNNVRKLIKGEHKLVLQTHQLHQINTILDIVETKPSDIIIYHKERRNLESFEKLLNNVPKLVVTQRSIYSIDNFIDLRRFKKLRHLELIRIPLQKVKGLKSLKPQLEFFLCDHCSEVETIAKCGKLHWSQLITIKLRNNPINFDTQHFFISMPWLQHLDLSFSRLKNLDALQHLDDLKYLNLSFNHLEKLPVLSAGTCAHLQILLINHNYLEDLQGIEYLANLRGLDISWNWISDNRNLAPLLKLKSLQWINMDNTPLSFNKYYRLYLAGAIGSSSAPHQFVIDGVSLSKKEQRFMGCGLGVVRCGKSYYVSNDIHPHETTNCASTSNTASSSSNTANKKALLAKVKNRLNSGKKSSKVREVVIEEYSDIAVDDTTRLIPKEEPLTASLATEIVPSLESKECVVNTDSQMKLIDSLIEENTVSEQNTDIKHDRENNESRQSNLNFSNNITLGLLEVEIHDNKNLKYSDEVNISPVENHEDKLQELDKEITSTPVIKDSGFKSLEHSESPIPSEVIQPVDVSIDNQQSETEVNQPIDVSIDIEPSETEVNQTISLSTDIEPSESEVNQPIDVSVDIQQSETVVNEPVDVCIDNQQSEKPIFTKVNQPVDEIKKRTESFLESETLNEQITTETFSDNEIKHESTMYYDQSEEFNSSAESHQDDQEYFSATEDKDRTKTLSSIDSSSLDLGQSRETVDFFESQQEDDDEQTCSSPAEENVVTNLTLSSVETPVNISPNFPDKIVTKMEVDTDTDSESSGNSDTEYDMWPVKKINNETKESQNILLILLENELKERSPITGRTVTKWSLNSVQSCVKTKNEPFTVELEFESEKVDKQFRTYVMEFSDAQVLMKRLYDILESRPLSAMNQATFKCLKCDSIFVQNATSKTAQVQCTICSSIKVVLMEEPRPPECKTTPQSKTVNHSPSHSSIGSAESLDQGQKLGLPPSTGAVTPKKYESDIEIISNPSQSSIEVLDEYGRSQGSTPHRKRSSEERQIVAIPQLGTVLEVNAQLSALTESSSSGSLTESVITTYETHNLINKKPKPEDCLIEESGEGSPDTELATSINQGTLYEENGNITQIISSDHSDIYNYNDFNQVDVRIKLFLYQSIFHDENEELLLLVKCHLWKTGDLDYDACVVFSTTKLYFFSHSQTNFKEETCDWLTLNDTVLLKEIKQISPIIWHQGAIVNVNKITYLILLLDKERTNNFFRFLEGLSLKEIKIRNYVNNKIEMLLQQAVLSNVTHKFDIVNPSIVSFAVCLKLYINKNDEEIIMRLGCLVITGSELLVIPGDLKWLCTEVSVLPKIHLSQPITNLIEVERYEKSFKLHFLDEGEAFEEIWTLKLATDEQVSSLINSIETLYGEFALTTIRGNS